MHEGSVFGKVLPALGSLAVRIRASAVRCRAALYPPAAIAARLALGLVSPTWGFAELVKGSLDADWATVFIRLMNGAYLAVASVLVVALLRSDLPLSALQGEGWGASFVLLAWYPFSRCTEVFVAFLRDATHKLDPARGSRSLLTWRGRVALAIRSFVELVLDFALIYALAPANSWQRDYAVTSLTDVLSYSATTITTSGGGGYAAADWRLQALTAYEIACGIILLVVCFTIYVGHALAEFPPRSPRPEADGIGDGGAGARSSVNE